MNNIFTDGDKKFLKDFRKKHPLIKIKGKVRFKCLKRCSDVCCGGNLPVILFDTDLRKEKLKNNVIKNKLNLFELKKEGPKCILLKNKVCSIYKQRPIVCRLYPFYLDPLTNELFYDSACKGVGIGEEVNLKEIAQLRNGFWEIFNLNKRERELIHKLMF